MFEAFKQMFRRAPESPGWPKVEAWAETRGFVYRRARDGSGFVVDGSFETRRWRLEWGPSQRSYLEGQELRVRMDFELPGQMQLLLLSRELMHAMESDTFERYTDHMQTHIDVSTPEEVRWLVLHPKLGLKPLPTLRGRIAAVGQPVPSLARWLEGPLARALERATDPFESVLSNSRPFVLMTSRNRVMLRIALPEASVSSIEQALELFVVAVSQTPQAIEGLEVSPSGWAQSGRSWQSQWHDDGGPTTR